MAEAKKSPVDRGKLMIALECCREQECKKCPYYDLGSCVEESEDALAYIGYLEEQLEEALGHDA